MLSKKSDWFLAIKHHRHASVTANLPRYKGSLNDDGESALMLAIRERDAKMIQLLARDEHGLVDSYGDTALNIAARIDYIQGVDLLFPYESSKRNHLGQSALMVASLANAGATVEHLMPEGRYDSDGCGRSPLVLAASADAVAAARALLLNRGTKYEIDLKLAALYAVAYDAKATQALLHEISASTHLTSDQLREMASKEADAKMKLLNARMSDLEEGPDDARRLELEVQVNELNELLTRLNSLRERLEGSKASKTTPDHDGANRTDVARRTSAVSRDALARKEAGPWKPLGGRNRTFDEIAAENANPHRGGTLATTGELHIPRSSSRSNSRAASRTQTRTRPSLSQTTPGFALSTTDTPMGPESELSTSGHRSKLPQPSFSPSYQTSRRDSLDENTPLGVSGTRARLAEIYRRKLEDKLKQLDQVLVRNRAGLFGLSKYEDNIIRIMTELENLIQDDSELRLLNLNWERAIDTRISAQTAKLETLAANRIVAGPEESYFPDTGDVGQPLADLIQRIVLVDAGDDTVIQPNDTLEKIKRDVSPVVTNAVSPSSPPPTRSVRPAGRYANATKYTTSTLPEDQTLIEEVIVEDLMTPALAKHDSITHSRSMSPHRVETGLMTTSPTRSRVFGSPDVTMVPEEQTYATMTRLMTAARNNDLKTVKNAKGTDMLRQQNTNGETALIYAARYGHAKVVKELADNEGGLTLVNGNTALIEAATHGKASVLPMLAGKEAKSRNAEGMTALMCGVKSSCVPVVKKLAKLEAGVQNPVDGSTALMMSVTNPALAKTLAKLEAGIQDSEGMTALMFAAEQGSLKVVKSLVKLEARKQNSQGQTALMLAARNGHKAICQALLCENAICDKDGKAAIDYAREAGQEECVALLSKAK
ncbi:Ankyrin repeat protein 1 [Giardia muris]|uniref:Ankyrin repeat protein 1 n=1 Tax=Giardia muris TaxID=5742 RepID=A0A4Z1SS64_GIAMU|nr:Ankyrin repeat protein 1 [Giardia muris]|eukprot:TNJ28772.1 Ankyrin repeat protein 1 [Giardia muris]